MKKFTAILLSFILICLTVVPALAMETPSETIGSDVPVIAMFGDGEAIYDEEGNKIFKFSEILNVLGSSEEGENGEDPVADAVISILQPFLLEGILRDEWDNYYAALEKEIGELFTEIRFDKNGENCNNSDISKNLREIMATQEKTDYKAQRGSYYVYDYQFWYDWRQDPRESAEELHSYIENIKKATGCDKVALLAHCLGTTVAVSYIAKYGTDSIYGVALDGSVIEGAEIISEAISGKFTLDGEGINRLILDMNSTGSANLSEFVTASIDLAIKSGVVGTLTDTVKATIYQKVVKGVTSALSLSTFFTWPGYWACVSEEDFDDALEYVFGEEDSVKREEYAGLIDKINGYHKDVRLELDNIYDEIEASGARIAVIGKYGFQIAPICKSSDQISDQYATLSKASLGATTAPSIFETFSDDYIAQREAEGKGKYISPDKLVDASTCRFPDYTWFTKNISHSYWHSFETALMFNVITADRQYTVNDFDCTQFVVHDYETGVVSPMTEDNCHTENWYDDVKDGQKTGFFDRIIAFFRSLINWFKALFSI